MLFLFGIQSYLHITTNTNLHATSLVKPSLPYPDWYKCPSISQLSLCYSTMFLNFSCLLIFLAYGWETCLIYVYSHGICIVLRTYWVQKKYLLYEWMNDARKAGFMNWQQNVLVIFMYTIKCSETQIKFLFRCRNLNIRIIFLV